jgi:hypothetical protein
MRSSICGAVGLAAVGLLTLAPVGATAQQAEFGLLGNKLWNTFDQVLRKQGQPTRIEVGAVAGTGQAAGGGGGGMAPMGMGMGMPGAGGPYGGGPGGGPGMSGMMQRMSQGGGMGKMGSSPYGAPGGGGPGLPGMAGMGMGQTPGDLGLGTPGGGQSLAGGGGGQASSGDEGEITWVYERPGGRTNIFLFNKDGRLIQVSAFGNTGTALTGKTVRLGDPIGKIYAKYGWTANITKDAARNTMMLDYSKDHHVAFQLADQGKGYRVIGITVGITELNQIPGGGGNLINARRVGGSMGGMMGGPTGAPMGGPMMAPGSGMGGRGRGFSGGGAGGGAASKAAD